MNEPGGSRTASEPHLHFPSSVSKPWSPSSPPTAPGRASVLVALAALCPEGIKRKCDSPDTPQIWGRPPTVNTKLLEKKTAETRALHVLTTHQVGPTCPWRYQTCGLLLPTPVARGFPPVPSGSAYLLTGDPSRPLRRARLRIRPGGRRYSAGTLAERKATGARSSLQRSPAGAPELTQAGRSMRPGR